VAVVVAGGFNVVTGAWPEQAETIEAPLDWFWYLLGEDMHVQNTLQVTLVLGYTYDMPIPRSRYFLFGGVCLPITVCLFSLAPSYISTSEMSCIKMLEVVRHSHSSNVYWSLPP